ncbi:hypothetical protein [Propionivibrio sp.]|uniref:hypothetical protein n=1 Tax=Propionivibrio sp. TaxID=2212460 RepID=UPI00261D1D0F|nr:hypothetical protein [Propionivibrio sp.]
MKIVRLALLGVILQMILLTAFILVSRSTHAQLAKPLVMGMAITSMLGLFLHAVKVHTIRRLILLSGLLAIGYIFGFHILGMLYFPGLLKDFDGLSMDYLQSVLSVTVMLFVIYVITALGLFWLKTFFTKKGWRHQRICLCRWKSG